MNPPPKRRAEDDPFPLAKSQKVVLFGSKKSVSIENNTHTDLILKHSAMSWQNLVGVGHEVTGDNLHVTGPRWTLRGDNNTLTGPNCRVYGDNNTLNGPRCSAYGDGNRLTGPNCFAQGDNNVLVGPECKAVGDNNRLGGPGCTAEGDGNVIERSGCQLVGANDHVFVQGGVGSIGAFSVGHIGNLSGHGNVIVGSGNAAACGSGAVAVSGSGAAAASGTGIAVAGRGASVTAGTIVSGHSVIFHNGKVTASSAPLRRTQKKTERGAEKQSSNGTEKGAAASRGVQKRKKPRVKQIAENAIRISGLVDTGCARVALRDGDVCMFLGDDDDQGFSMRGTVHRANYAGNSLTVTGFEEDAIADIMKRYEGSASPEPAADSTKPNEANTPPGAGDDSGDDSDSPAE